MARCSSYVNCTVVGFNFGYVTLAIGIIGVSFIRRITSDEIRYSLRLYTMATDEGDRWRYPFHFYIYASFIPLAVSTVALLLAFLWVTLIRPACFGEWKSVCCKEATSVLFVILMIAYTGSLFPGPIYGIEYSDKLSNDTQLRRIEDELSLAIRNTSYYTTPRDELSPENAKTTDFGEALDYLQRKNKCCGFRGPQDYNQNNMNDQFRFRYGIPFPYSCCALIKPENGSKARIDWPKCRAMRPDYFYNDSCFANITEKVQESFYILDGAGFSAVAIGIIAVILSVIFAVMNLVIQSRSRKNKQAGSPVRRGNRGDSRA